MKPVFGRTRPVRARLIAVVLFLALTGSLLPAAPPAAALTSTPQPTATPRPTRTPTPTVTATPTLPATEPDLIAAGHEALLASNFARAEEAFQAAIKLDSTSSAALVGLSRTYAVQMGRQREALAAAEQAVELDPAYVPGWIALADAQIRLNLVTDALASAEKAVESVGTATIAAEAQAALANAYRIDSQPDEALAAAARAVELDGQSAAAYAALGLVHQDRGDLGRAINALKRAVELEPQFVWWRLLLGHTYAVIGETALSAAEYDRIVRIAPDYGYAQIGQAQRDADLGNDTRSNERLSKLREAYPNAVEPRRALAHIIRYTQGSAAAVGRFEDALRIAPTDLETRLGLARSLYESGNCARAETILKALLKEWPRNAIALELFSLTRLCLSDASGALKYARQAIDANPYYLAGYLRAAEALYSDGRTDEAIAMYLSAMRIGHRDGQEHSSFGAIFYDQGDLERALYEYSLAALMWPNWAWPAYALCAIYIGQDRLDLAHQACDAGYETDASDPAMARQYVWVLLREGRPQEALEILAGLDANDAATQLLLGVAYYMTNRYPAAIEAFDRHTKLSRSNNPQLKELMAALKGQYRLSHAEAQELAAQRIPAAIGRPVTISFEKEPGRTGLVVEVKGQPGEKPERIVIAALQALGYMGQIAPRMTPVVSGAHVRAVASDGEPILAAFAGVGPLREYMLGLISDNLFLSRITYESLKTGDTADDAAWSEEEVRELGRQAEAVRELRAIRPVSFEAITQAELEAELAARADEDIEALKQDEAALRLLGLIERNVNLAKTLTAAQASSLLGYYDPQKKAFVYVSDKTPSALEKLTIVHEYVHALQDQHFTFGLPTTQVDNDRRLAYRALVEGDAQLATNLYADTALGLSDLLSASLASSADRLNQEKLDQMPPTIVESLRFPYAAGLDFASLLYRQGGLEALNSAFAAPPRSTEQILHVDKYLSQEQPVTVKAPALPAALKDAWRVADSNVFGELGWRLALQARLGPMAAIYGAAGWGGDRYTLFQKGEKATYMLAAAAVWDTEAEAQEFAELYTSGIFGTQGVTETTTDLLSSRPVRTYKERGFYTAFRLDGKQTFLVVGPDEPAVQAVLEGMK
ncbi:MAG: tetratricopeptide repeat protein [Chloroflexi bacterium ADurb.Bin325]|nr:MAG: tetratricopeptide repeat protein [Chloroflexi bacterium ADurb.Bin325]